MVAVGGGNAPPRFNGAPGQEHWVIRQHPHTGERHLDRLWWGLIPNYILVANVLHMRNTIWAIVRILSFSTRFTDNF